MRTFLAIVGGLGILIMVILLLLTGLNDPLSIF